MRFIRRLLSASLMFLGLAIFGFSQNNINPGNQIRWPAPSCNVPTGAYLPGSNICQDISKIATSQIVWPLPSCANVNGVYNPATNLCVDISKIPPSHITFPVPCVGVYSPSTNTCVPTGTANNPGGAPGDTQMNSGGNFAKATAVSVGNSLYDPGTVSFLIGNVAPTIGFPFPPGSGLVNEILIGNRAGQNIGNYTPITTTGTASSGSTSLVVASVAGILFGVGGPIVSGAGIAPGTTVVNVVGTTLTLSLATTAALSNTPVSFTPGPTGSLIAIGNSACQSCASNNGSVVIGQGALANDVGYGTGGEDQNGVVIGPFAGSGEVGSSCTTGSFFESIIIGNKVGLGGCGWGGTQMIGNHISGITGANNSTLIGNEIGVGAGIFIVPSGVVGIGRDLFNGALGSLPALPPGTYNVNNTNCIGFRNCAHALSQNNFVYGAFAFNGRTDGTVITGSNNDVFGANTVIRN